MKKNDIIRAWKDEEFRSALSADELAALPENPAGAVELDDADLDTAGGNDLTPYGSIFNCSYEFYGCGTGCIYPCGTWGGGGDIFGPVCPWIV